MKIWKCDMCGTILENEDDVMTITCKEGSDKDFYPNSYEVCRECARKVNKFIRTELTMDLYPALKTIYNYCRWKENCDDCLFNEAQNGGQFKCMVGLPEDNWAKFYPDLKKGSDEK